MTAIFFTILALLGLSLTALLVGLVAQERAIRRVLPWVQRYLETHAEGAPLEIAAWVTQHIHPVHHLVVSAALRRLEHQGMALSRLVEANLPPERNGHPCRYYRQTALPTRALA
jgi:hypothetical protein